MMYGDLQMDQQQQQLYSGLSGETVDPIVQLLDDAERNAITPESIDTKIQAFMQDYADLHKRMDDDQNLYDLKAYNANKDGTDTFPSYTSNSPRTFAKKVTALLTSGDPFVRIPYVDADKEKRARYESKERFLYGLL